MRERARAYLTSGEIFLSPKLGYEYRVFSVTEQTIGIERARGENTVLTPDAVTEAVNRLNSAGGRVPRTKLLTRVARETAFVNLHPQVDWSRDREWIEVSDAPGAGERIEYRDFGQAPNDDPAELQQFARRVRAGQAKFRENLLRLYGESCAITGWGPAAVLEAAHILWHFKSGVNDTGNGILLRSDLHTLFDEGLLRIDPERLVVVLDPSLEGTRYWDLDGAPLHPRVDGSHPNRDYVETRWASSLPR